MRCAVLPPTTTTTPPQGHESESDGEADALAPEQERAMLADVVGSILGQDGDGEGEAEEEEEEPQAGSEEGQDEEEGLAGSDWEEGSEGAPASGDEQEPQAPAGAGAPRAAAQPAQAAVGVGGTTVFVRGLPLDCTKEQLFTKMKVSSKFCGPASPRPRTWICTQPRPSAIDDQMF